jgi:membrane-associated protein
MYFRRLGGWAIFFSRFLVSALGGEINLLAGAEFYPYQRFLLYDLSGETLGALLPLSLGYIFGASWVAVGDILGSFSLFLLTLLIVLVLGYQTLRLLIRMRRAARLKRQQALALWPPRQHGEAVLSTPGLSPTLPLSAGNPDEASGRPGH